MTDMNPLVLPLQPADDLFRAPGLAEQGLNLLPAFGVDPGVGLVVPARQCQSMSLPRPIPKVVGEATVAPELPADGGLVPRQHGRDFGFPVPGFHQGFNLIAFFSSQLYVASHMCSSSLPVRKATMLPHLARSPSNRVALTS